MNKLYENVGKNIMTMAKIIGNIYFWGGLLAGFILMVSLIDIFWVGLVVMVSGVLCGLLTLPLYGFGLIVDKMDDKTEWKKTKPDAVPEELPEL